MWLLHCDTNKLILLLQDECCWYIVDQIAIYMYKTSLDNLLQLLLWWWWCLWMLCIIHQHHHKTLRKIFIVLLSTVSTFLSWYNFYVSVQLHLFSNVFSTFPTYRTHFLVQILRNSTVTFILKWVFLFLS